MNCRIHGGRACCAVLSMYIHSCLFHLVRTDEHSALSTTTPHRTHSTLVYTASTRRPPASIPISRWHEGEAEKRKLVEKRGQGPSRCRYMRRGMYVWKEGRLVHRLQRTCCCLPTHISRLARYLHWCEWFVSGGGGRSRRASRAKKEEHYVSPALLSFAFQVLRWKRNNNVETYTAAGVIPIYVYLLTYI